MKWPLLVIALLLLISCQSNEASHYENKISGDLEELSSQETSLQTEIIEELSVEEDFVSEEIIIEKEDVTESSTSGTTPENILQEESSSEPTPGELIDSPFEILTQNEEQPLELAMADTTQPIEVPENSSLRRGSARILIDPGHGGSDPGAMSGAWTEKYLNGQISFFLGEMLKEAGYSIEYTRDPLNLNASLPLDQRVQRMNATEQDLIISIHHNAAFQSGPKGYSILYSSYRPYSDQIGIEVATGGKIYPWVAEEIRDNVTYMYFKDGDNTREIHGNHVYTVIDHSPGEEAAASLHLAEKLHLSMLNLDYISPQYMSGRSRPIVSKENRVLRLVRGPSVIVECGFMTNPQELNSLVREENQKKMAHALARGIIDFLNNPSE